MPSPGHPTAAPLTARLPLSVLFPRLHGEDGMCAARCGNGRRQSACGAGQGRARRWPAGTALL